MKSACFALVALFGVLVAVAEPQFYFNSPWQYPSYPSYFRSSGQQPDYQQQLSQLEARLFFGTQTLTLTTITSTSTSTSVTTCTTSTAALSACVAAAGRRRRQTKGLYYSEDDDNVFLVPAAKVERSAGDAPAAEDEKPTPAVQVPFVVQPGFEHMTNNRQARFLIAFASATTTVTTTTTSTSTLIAVCSSTAAYQLCGSNGK